MTTTEAPARTGLLLPCPKCGEAGATIDLCLADADTLHCQDCDESYPLDEVKALVERWRPVLAWIDQMPKA